MKTLILRMFIYSFQNEPYDSKLNTSDKSDDTNPNGKGTNNGLPDLINQKGYFFLEIYLG